MDIWYSIRDSHHRQCHRIHKERQKRRLEGIRTAVSAFLCCGFVLFDSVFRRTLGATTRNWYHPLWHYRLIGEGKVLLFPEVIMNVVVFVPIGFALGIAFRKLKGWQAVLVGMGISVGIELLQGFFRKGFADIDDVIHNVLGCALGFLGWWIFRRGVER